MLKLILGMTRVLTKSTLLKSLFLKRLSLLLTSELILSYVSNNVLSGFTVDKTMLSTVDVVINSKIKV
jgi:hypothetical protein